MSRIVVCTVVLLIVIAASGCSGPATPFEPNATPTRSRSAAPSAMAPESPSPIPSLPVVPAGLPVMPGAEAGDPADYEPGVIARWTVDVIGPQVYQYYLDALPAAGFAVEDRIPGGNVAIIRFVATDGTTRELSLIGEGDGSRTRIDLVFPEGP